MSEQAFLDILVEFLTPEQRKSLLQAFTNSIHDDTGICPVCDIEAVPIDPEGDEIEDGDVSMAAEWSERHDEECLIALFEATVNRKEAQHSA